MRAVVQRVSRARVDVAGETVGQIGSGLLVLLGVETGDSKEQCVWLADRVAKLRIFPDDAGKMNLDLRTVGGSALVVSQFTLLGDCTSGRRPGFTRAARPEEAKPLVDQFVEELMALGVPVATGRFGADMQVELVNNGPVTLLMETPARKTGGDSSTRTVPSQKSGDQPKP